MSTLSMVSARDCRDGSRKVRKMVYIMASGSEEFAVY